MSKQNLIITIAQQTGSTEAAAKRTLDAVLQGLVTELSNGNEVRIVGFGSFSPVHKEARQVRSPQTGKAIDVPAKTTVKFKAGSKLLEAVN
jgi:DNA-binding protein HU-beta